MFARRDACGARARIVMGLILLELLLHVTLALPYCKAKVAHAV